MNITTHRIKQCDSTYKTVVSVDGMPICTVAGVGKTVANVIAYLNGKDECEKCNSNVFGSIYRIIDKYKAGEE